MVTSLRQIAPTRVRCAPLDGEDVVFTSSIMDMFVDALGLTDRPAAGRRHMVFVRRSSCTTSIASSDSVTTGGRTMVRVRPHRLRRTESVARVSPRAAVFPSGVIADAWRPRHTAPPRIEELPKPRAIYTGTIDDRLEASLVERTAGAVGSLIMIGGVGEPAVLRWLRSIDHVHVVQAVGRLELASTVQACDIFCVIPHRITLERPPFSPAYSVDLSDSSDCYCLTRKGGGSR